MVDTGEYHYHLDYFGKYQVSNLHSLINRLQHAFNVDKSLEWPITDSDVEILEKQGIEWLVLDLLKLTREEPEIAKLFYENHVRYLRTRYENGYLDQIPQAVTMVELVGIVRKYLG